MTSILQDEDVTHSGPVVVDYHLLPSPPLPRRSTSPQQTDTQTDSPALDLSFIKTKIDVPNPVPPKIPERAKSPSSPLEPYIITARIEKYGESGTTNPNTAYNSVSPNTVNTVTILNIHKLYYYLLGTFKQLK